MKPVATVAQIWHSFRSEDYKRHRIIGRLALLNMAGALASAAAFAVEHLRSDSLAEQVTETAPMELPQHPVTVICSQNSRPAVSYLIGLTTILSACSEFSSLNDSRQIDQTLPHAQVSGAGFAALIAAAGYNLAAGYAAARRRDIAAHQRCMVRMVGLAYGVFPFKHIYVVLASLLLPGHWAYAAAVWLSSPTGELWHRARVMRANARAACASGCVHDSCLP